MNHRWVGIVVLVSAAASGSPARAAAQTGSSSGASPASTAITGQVVGYTAAAGVFEVSADGARARQVPGTDAGSGSPAWSHDGDVVAFTEAASPGNTSSDVGLDTVAADGSCRVAFPNPAHGVFSGPSWSKDGSRLAFVRADPPPGPTQLETARSDGTGALGLPATTPGQWAPDGSQRVLLIGGGGIEIVDVATGRARVLDPTFDAEFPAWSPDARHVAYSISTQPAVWVVNADGTGKHRLTPVDPADSEDFFPAWSPDGSRIAFQRSGPSGVDVWVVHADGTGAHAVTTSHTVGSGGPLWSPDGTMLAYNQQAGPGPDPPQDVWVVNADGSDPLRVAQNAQAAAFFSRSLPVSDAGYRLVSATGSVSGFGTECSLGSGPVSVVLVPPGPPPRVPRPAAMAGTSDGGGYWLVDATGFVISFGDAAFHGSAAGRPLNRPIVGMAATADGGGYWL
ncbi:MAG TPA: hypothetical protein VFW24_06615, partial [Acidimicrobiales bacterium]|nr:hypothetical protein [Acidimicrobiales bacterium]